MDARFRPSLAAARLPAVFIACSVAVLGGQAPSTGVADHAAFLQEVRHTLQSDRLLQRQYTCREKRTEVRLNDEGAVIARSVKIVDNAGLDRAKRLEQESPRQRDTRLRDEADDARKDSEIVDDAFRLYDFQIAGSEPIDGYAAVLLTFAPAPGVQARTREGRLFQKFSGRAWVSESDHHLIRVEVEAIDDVTMGFGLLARIYKGSQVVFQRRKVDDTVWLPSELRYSAGGRVLLVKKLRVDAVREYSEYRRIGVETVAPLPQRVLPK